MLHAQSMVYHEQVGPDGAVSLAIVDRATIDARGQKPRRVA
jgi:hypothetical protein